MYVEYVLLSIGGISLLAAFAISLYLAISKKDFEATRNIVDSDTTLDLEELTDKTSSKALSKIITLPIDLNPNSNESNSELSANGDINAENAEETIYITSGEQNENELRTIYLQGKKSKDINGIDGINENGRGETVKSKRLLDKYTLDGTITGGGMSQVYLATNKELGNKWIVKLTTDPQMIALSKETDILKRINHINLPTIVDIFPFENGLSKNKGMYIVESYIEGVSLKDIMREVRISQNLIVEWSEQLMQVISYLHRFEPTPVVHCDLKPGNIIITPDKKPVLIDFGISQFGEESNGIRAVTKNYAAPEQFGGKFPAAMLRMIERDSRLNAKAAAAWKVDKRADIYSLGVIMFELATGRLPEADNKELLAKAVVAEFKNLILKCLEINPDNRYQSIEEMLADIKKVKNAMINVERRRVLRKVSMFTAIAMMLVATVTSTAGGYRIQQESTAVIAAKPEKITVSVQQTSAIQIEKIFTSGKINSVDVSSLDWSADDGNVAQVDGIRILGINEGTSNLVGTYRNKAVSVEVNVVAPLDGMVDIALHYKKGGVIQKLVGTGERDIVDGGIEGAGFISPESIAVGLDNAVYVTDAGILRKISQNQVTSLPLDDENYYLSSRMIRISKNDMYVLTDIWQDAYDGRYYYSLIRLSGTNPETVLTMDAENTAIIDYNFTQDGQLYFIHKNAQTMQNYICSFNLQTSEIDYLREVDTGVCTMAISGNEYIFIANQETGAIQRYSIGANELINFAGIANERLFIDGNAPLFYQPMKLQIYKDELYVLDFNVIRKISIDGENKSAVYAQTVVGEVSTEKFVDTLSGAAEDAILEYSKLRDFYVTDSGIYVTDPQKSVIWLVKGE